MHKYFIKFIIQVLLKQRYEKETGKAQGIPLGIKLQVGEKGIDNSKVPLGAATSFLEACYNHILAYSCFFRLWGLGLSLY